MKKSYYIHLIVLLLTVGGVYSDPRITLFFQPAPLTDAEKISQKLRKPGKLAKYVAKGMLTTSIVEGIIATYGGYIAASDYNGEVSFTRKHQKPTVDVIITSEIIPVPLFESTILHWKRVPGVPAVRYTCQELYDGQKSEYYWQVDEVALSEDMAIPLAAIIIIAKPKNISIEMGKTPINETGNLILPNFYVKKGINIIENSTYVLTIRHLFKPVETRENREPLKIITQITD